MRTITQNSSVNNPENNPPNTPAAATAAEDVCVKLLVDFGFSETKAEALAKRRDEHYVRRVIELTNLKMERRQLRSGKTTLAEHLIVNNADFTLLEEKDAFTNKLREGVGETKPQPVT
jgi:hypothetical protein